MPHPAAGLALAALLVASCTPAATPITTPAPTSGPTGVPAAASTSEATGGPATPSLEASSASSALTSAATPAQRPSASPPSTAPRPLSLVVVGDSIPYNRPQDCPGCTGVATRYARAIELATGRDVKLTNLSEYTGLRVEGLLAELRSDAVRRTAIAGADIVLITIAHNNVVCPDWDLDRLACATLADEYRATYAKVFAAVVALRGGRTTAFRTVNRYNDVTEPGASAGDAAGSKLILDAWNAMVCEEAAGKGFLSG